MVVKLPDSCVEVGVPLGSWVSGIPPCCPNCRQELRLSLSVAPCCGTLPLLRSPPSPLALLLPSMKQPNYFVHRSSQRATPILSAKCNNEITRLKDTLKMLSLSGWYYGSLDWQSALTFLKDANPGAFIIRDSGDKNFIFSLSVQTERGPTSVRLHYEKGFFRLDCDEALAMYMPRFRCVIELVQHYSSKNAAGSTVWVDRKGCPHSPVLLKTPLRRSPPSLAHAARLAVHKVFNAVPKIQSSPKYRFLPLPNSLLDYLGEYPYSI